jgi:hypothetical protein
MDTNPPSRDSVTPAKSVLFCPDCGHASRFDDGWHVVATADGTQQLCPVCGAEIASRPRTDAAPSWPVLSCSSIRRTWDASARLWRTVWRQSVALWLR